MNRTAIVYDPFNLRHTLEGHPENYHRLEETWKLLQLDGILNHLVQLPSYPAPLDALLRVHTAEYLERLESTSLFGGGHLDADTYVNPDSYQAALLAAGGLLSVVDAVLSGSADNGFALIRPPGHHALSNRGMGFCLLANAAIAARWAQDRHGAERVLIVDFDVHHGNGTQDIFYRDPSVLFFSTHQYPYYPGTGSVQEIGGNQAQGSTINVPFPARVGDTGYLAAFREILAPAAKTFKPDLIILSAGFDAHWLDPLAGMLLSIRGYTKLLETLMEIAGDVCAGRLVCVLEGGYHLQVLAHCVLSALRVLSSAPQGASDPFGPPRSRERDVTGLMTELRSLHRTADGTYYSLPGSH